MAFDPFRFFLYFSGQKIPMTFKFSIYKFEEFYVIYISETHSGEQLRSRLRVAIGGPRNKFRLGWGDYRSVLSALGKALKCSHCRRERKKTHPLVVRLRNRQRLVVQPREVGRLHATLLRHLESLGFASEYGDEYPRDCRLCQGAGDLGKRTEEQGGPLP